MKKISLLIKYVLALLLSCSALFSADLPQEFSFELVFDKGLVPNVSFSAHDGLFTLVDQNNVATLSNLEVNYQLSRIGLAYEGLKYELLLILSDASYADNTTASNNAYMLKRTGDEAIGLNYDVVAYGPVDTTGNINVSAREQRITIDESRRNEPIPASDRTITLLGIDDFIEGRKYAEGTFNLNFTMNPPEDNAYMNGTYSGYAILRLNVAN